MAATAVAARAVPAGWFVTTACRKRNTPLMANPFLQGHRAFLAQPSQAVRSRIAIRRAPTRAALAQPTAVPPFDSTTVITALFALSAVEDWLTAIGVPQTLIDVFRVLGTSVALLKLIKETRTANAEISKANAEADKAAVAKLELQLKEREMVVKERELARAEEEEDPFYKVKLQLGDDPGVVRLERGDITKLVTLTDVLKLCLRRSNQDENEARQKWELLVEDDAILRILGPDDDVVGLLLKRRVLVLRRKE